MYVIIWGAGPGLPGNPTHISTLLPNGNIALHIMQMRQYLIDNRMPLCYSLKRDSVSVHTRKGSMFQHKKALFSGLSFVLICLFLVSACSGIGNGGTSAATSVSSKVINVVAAE